MSENLWQRMCAVRKEIENIPKNGRAPAEMGGFPFVTEADVTEAGRRLLAEHGIATFHTMPHHSVEPRGHTSSGKTIYHATACIEVTYCNADNPEEAVVVKWVGEADDMGDKAISKAVTSATKNERMKNLQVSGEVVIDPDAADATAGEGRRGATSDEDFGGCPDPNCDGHLVKRIAKQGRFAGQPFIVCTTCRHVDYDYFRHPRPDQPQQQQAETSAQVSGLDGLRQAAAAHGVTRTPEVAPARNSRWKETVTLLKELPTETRSRLLQSFREETGLSLVGASGGAYRDLDPEHGEMLFAACEIAREQWKQEMEAIPF